jgi:alanyl-tRNA synthetase
LRAAKTMQTSHELRRAFLDFFAARDHQVVASSSLVPTSDPTLMFTNAGMVQFKDVFTGREVRPYRRATSSQKCIRISGKHNDLESVGPSPRHHTFFEMLGNFSFGDYFKEEAIVFAWDFLTQVLDLPKDRLICTYFAGDEAIPGDEFARDTWQRVTGFGDDRVRGLGRDDNFWQMGETGPCGPCSEIYFYHGPSVELATFGAEQTPEGFGWMEIWNLVFMQFERRQMGDNQYSLSPLPAPSIDTGAGLERLSSVVQHHTSNYDTDLLRGLIDRTSSLAGKHYGGSMAADDVSMRVIADHARTTAFLLAEGIMPDRTGREYVLRRVMRRAIRHGHRLGITRPFLHQVVLEVVAQMGEHYPELRERQDLLASVTEQEEIRFRQTIERGLGLLEERFQALEVEGQRVLGGQDAFQLYDTFGFPLDLTEVICTERGYRVDLDGYEAALGEARKKSVFGGMDRAVETIYHEALGRLGPAGVAFTGYEREADESPVVALMVGGELVSEAGAGSEVEVVTERTPFYGETGGQVGDQGTIETPGGKVGVTDTQRPVAGLVVHRGTVLEGRLEVGQTAKLVIDSVRRDAIRRNHSATHLLHWALRTVLGPHAQQKGSVVAPDRLRFDFTHGQALEPDQIRRIEDLVNQRIWQNVPVRTEILELAEARRRGAMMIFEEKYGATVRMLSMAESTELCGGTHVRATGDIGLVKVLGEQAIAAGVRRITAITAGGVVGYVRELEERMERAARALKSSPAELPERLERLVAGQRALEKQVEELEKKLATGGGGGIDAILAQAREVGDVKVLGLRTELGDRSAMRELCEQLRDRLGESIVLVGSEKDGKAQLVLMVAKALAGRFNAGELIRPIAAIVGGTGGGRPDMAQAGGTDAAALDQAIDKLYELVS